jgi:hypothetical protein
MEFEKLSVDVYGYRITLLAKKNYFYPYCMNWIVWYKFSLFEN